MTWLHRKSERIDLKLIIIAWLYDKKFIYKSLSLSYVPAMNKLNLKLKTHYIYIITPRMEYLSTNLTKYV